VDDGGIGVWGNVIIAIATLSGVFIAQWHARKMRRLDLHEERRVEQRKALAEVLATGREYVISLEAVMLGASVPREDVDFVNSPGSSNTAPSPGLTTGRCSPLASLSWIRWCSRMSQVVGKPPEQVPSVAEQREGQLTGRGGSL
jgi:hypothetical protein